MTKLFTTACALLMCLLVAGSARAEDLDAIGEGDKAIARELVAAGDERFASGDYEGALRAYRGADTIMGVPTTGIEVARVLHALGRDDEALVVAAGVLSYPQRDDEPAPFAHARAAADRLVQEISGARVEQPVAHEATAPAPLEPASEPPSPLVWSGVALAAAGLIVGSITGGLSLATLAGVDSRCVGDVCPESARDDVDHARALAHASTASFVVAGAGGLLALVGVLLSLDSEQAGDEATRPRVRVAGCGLEGSF